MKGIYPHGKKFRVRKYDRHIGVYDTQEEAIEAVIRADNEELEGKMWNQYLTAKKWLIEKGLLNGSR